MLMSASGTSATCPALVSPSDQPQTRGKPLESFSYLRRGSEKSQPEVKPMYTMLHLAISATNRQCGAFQSSGGVTQMLAIDTEDLDRNGFAFLKRIVPQTDIDEFEAAITSFSEAQLRNTKTPRRASEPFIDVFSRGGLYAERVYKLLEDLFVLHRISVHIGQELRSSGFLDWAKIEVPLIWPDIRADLPNSKSALPVHQDYASTKCHNAWRLWIPLRPSNARTGSMLVYPGTHKAGVVPHNTEDPLNPFVEAQYYSGIQAVVLDLPAGDGVLISPLLLHASVPNRAERVKFTLMIQVQDYATMVHPNDKRDKFAIFERISSARAQARAAYDPRFDSPTQ